MQLVEKGTGSPVVLVPGIQGRCEWMRPAVEALARRCRVITFSLADERTCGAAFDPANGFACYVQQIADAMDAAGVERAAICGVSYGGLIAAAFAARHPERVSALILVSAIPPTWKPDSRVRFFLRAPRLLTPLFIAGSVRMYGEIAAASHGTVQALTLAARHAVTVLTHMFSPMRMARRVALLDGLSLEPELRPLRVPTLVITGETQLDRVVPVQLTHEYLHLWPHAEQITLANTGHIGLVTRAGEFARVVSAFVDRVAPMATAESRRRIV
jgi:pimeloyl-ACP methyl ester carboxylesterase